VLGGYEGAFPGLCHKCRKQRPRYKQAVAAYRYADPLSRVIPLWKYESQRHLSEALSGLLIDWVASSAPEWWEKVDIVVPVPHHPRTVRVRGFSPPEDLAAAICESYSLQYVPRALFKTRLTRPQMGLNFESRVANLRGSMRVFDPPLVLDRTVLLVDDVMTTGATLDECARALMDAGAFQVYGIVLARQSTVLQRDTCPSLDINLLQVL
jgi:ComF family protein